MTKIVVAKEVNEYIGSFFLFSRSVTDRAANPDAGEELPGGNGHPPLQILLRQVF
jgi:hypothetical protein